MDIRTGKIVPNLAAKCCKIRKKRVAKFANFARAESLTTLAEINKAFPYVIQIYKEFANVKRVNKIAILVLIERTLIKRKLNYAEEH